MLNLHSSRHKRVEIYTKKVKRPGVGWFAEKFQRNSPQKIFEVTNIHILITSEIRVSVLSKRVD